MCHRFGEKEINLFFLVGLRFVDFAWPQIEAGGLGRKLKTKVEFSNAMLLSFITFKV